MYLTDVDGSCFIIDDEGKIIIPKVLPEKLKENKLYNNFSGGKLYVYKNELTLWFQTEELEKEQQRKNTLKSTLLREIDTSSNPNFIVIDLGLDIIDEFSRTKNEINFATSSCGLHFFLDTNRTKSLTKTRVLSQ